MSLSPSPAPSLRIDKLLWHLRFAKTRKGAQAMVERGHIRLNGRRIEKASAAARIGDILTIPLRDDATVIRLLALPLRRGSASDAASAYEALTNESDSQQKLPR